jgi:hypothetical protein
MDATPGDPDPDGGATVDRIREQVAGLPVGEPEGWRLSNPAPHAMTLGFGHSAQVAPGPWLARQPAEDHVERAAAKHRRP